MRVGLVVLGDLELVSGGNLYDRKLVEHLDGRGHEVEIIALPDGSYAHQLAQNFSPSLGRRLRSASFDVLLQDELVHPSLFLLNRRVSRPIVSIVHHLRSSEDRPQWQNDCYRRVEKRYLESVGAFVYNSRATRESVEDLLGKKTEHVVATPGGDRLPGTATAAQVRARALDNGPLRLLFVGNLIERKCLHVLVDALGRLRDQAWHLDIVGNPEMDSRYAGRIQERIDALGIGARISTHGTLDGERLAERYRDGQLLVVPSSYEGFGIVYLEAMGFGLPAIGGAAGATNEIVQHESTGILVPPGDTVSLARELERLIGDRDLLSRLSLAALESFERHPGWEQSMSTIERFLTATSAARS